jgi:UTP-glucose-1-phosphate uridylyltransferase
LRTHEIDGYQTVYQDEQRGTAHAVLCSKPTWVSEYILVINGDMPLVSQPILEKLFTTHEEQKATISFVTSHAEASVGAYGRVIQEGNSIAIVEAKEFKGDPSTLEFILLIALFWNNIFSRFNQVQSHRNCILQILLKLHLIMAIELLLLPPHLITFEALIPLRSSGL